MVLVTKFEAPPNSAILNMITEVTQKAASYWKPNTFQGAMPKDGFGIAELAPYHCMAGGTGWGSSEFWAASIAASNTWQDWMNVTLTDMTYVIATGVFDLEATPIVTALRPKMNGQDYPAMNVEQIFALEEARAFWQNPWYAEPQENFTLRIKGKDAAVERIGLMGYAIAQRAYLILEK